MARLAAGDFVIAVLISHDVSVSPEFIGPTTFATELLSLSLSTDAQPTGTVVCIGQGSADGTQSVSVQQFPVVYPSE